MIEYQTEKSKEFLEKKEATGENINLENIQAENKTPPIKHKLVFDGV
jgi:hypothetical protein